MNDLFTRPLGAIFLAAGIALCSVPQQALASDAAELLGPGHWRAVVSPFSHHFRYNAEHKYVWALGVERQRDDGWLAGGSYFRNSFGQPSGYLYVGKRWSGWFGEPQLFAQASGGLLYGYRGAYKNKVPLNYNGFSPGALVSAGWQFNREAAVTLHLLGDAAAMVQLSWDFK